MFMPVVPAILTRNKRHCSRFRNSVSLVCWSYFWSCYKDSVLSIAKCEILINNKFIEISQFAVCIWRVNYSQQDGSQSCYFLLPARPFPISETANSTSLIA